MATNKLLWSSKLIGVFFIMLVCTLSANAQFLRRDIPKIIKFKATNSLRVSCLFCIFKHSPPKTV